jgi:hypothetical protein
VAGQSSTAPCVSRWWRWALIWVAVLFLREIRVVSIVLKDSNPHEDANDARNNQQHTRKSIVEPKTTRRIVEIILPIGQMFLRSCHEVRRPMAFLIFGCSVCHAQASAARTANPACIDTVDTVRCCGASSRQPCHLLRPRDAHRPRCVRLTTRWRAADLLSPCSLCLSI